MQGGGDIHFTLDVVYGAVPTQLKANVLAKRGISKEELPQYLKEKVTMNVPSYIIVIIETKRK